ncbi:non-structural maintenance of chromosomes element 1 homolog [Armigeres subalbatus]|uniref:non-structural maintenance of chromosomes element 1 homolog n=1 Tax=Armigeres subalbatus TaxID=124917 RepID=UPI002ED2AC55
MSLTSAYSNTHRGFLQSCALHGIIAVDHALKILINLSVKYAPDDPAPTEDQLHEIVTEVNARIDRYDQRLIRLEYDPTHQDYYVFANLSDTPLDRFQTSYTGPEVQFFRVILHELACREGYRVGQIDCLNLTSKVVVPGGGRVSLTKSRAEELINEWLTGGYLALTGKEISFGPRTMVEFDRYLLKKFPDQMRKCRLCKEVLFYGVKCAKCPEMLHKSCMKKYLVRMKKCPACNKIWTASLE